MPVPHGIAPGPVPVTNVGGPVPYVEGPFPVRRLKHFPVRCGAGSRPPSNKPVPLWFVNICDKRVAANTRRRQHLYEYRGVDVSLGETFRDVYEIYLELTKVKKNHNDLQQIYYREREQHGKEREELCELNQALRLELLAQDRIISDLRYYSQTLPWCEENEHTAGQFPTFSYNGESVFDIAREPTSRAPVFESHDAIDLIPLPPGNTPTVAYTQTTENFGNTNFEANLKFIAFPDLHGAQFHSLVALIKDDIFFAKCIKEMENNEISFQLTQRRYKKPQYFKQHVPWAEQTFHGTPLGPKSEKMNAGLLLATPAAAHLANTWVDKLTKEGFALSNNVIIVESGDPPNGGLSMFYRLDKIITQWGIVKKMGLERNVLAPAM